MNLESHSQPRRSGLLRRIRHPKRVFAFGLVVSLLLVVAFIAGQQIKSPDADALLASQSQLTITAVVEERNIAEELRISGKVLLGPSFDVVITEASPQASAAEPGTAAEPGAAVKPGTAEVNATAPTAPQPQSIVVPDIEKAVVSKVGVAPGSVVQHGSFLGEVSSRPVFAVPAELPVFRNIAPGVTGSDVKALQQLLIELGYGPVRVSGTCDTSTINALKRLYSTSGYQLPYVADGVQGFAWREFAKIPASNVTVIAASPLGAELTPETSFLKLKLSADRIVAQANPVQAKALTPGTRMFAQLTDNTAGEAPAATVVETVGEFQRNPDTQQAFHEVVLTLPQAFATGNYLDAQVQITGTNPAVTGPAVPLNAVKQDGGQNYVIVLNEGNEERVPVTVTVQAGGWVGLSPTDAVPVGATVKISG